MTNFERVAELAGELMTVSIHSNDGVLDLEMDIDDCSIQTDADKEYLSISSLNGSEITIDKDEILSVEENKVKLRNYILVF